MDPLAKTQAERDEEHVRNHEVALRLAQEDWDFDGKRRIHCANCRHAIVYGDSREPSARCEMGYGVAEMSLLHLIRRASPRQFKTAKDCEGFDSMSEEGAPGCG